MLNKKIWLKTVLLLGSIVGFSLSFASSAWFNVNLKDEVIQAIDMEAITKNIMPVHFVDNWNDFGWFIYSEGGEDVEDAVLHIWDHYGESVKFEGWNWYVCKHRINWFYYNSERWERLFPIDEGTAAKWRNLGLQPWLTTNGWLYTECMSAELDDALMECKDRDDVNPDDLYDEGQCERNARNAYGFNGYYWMITHKYNWKDFGLIFGAQYRQDSSTWISVDNRWLAETFIRYENKYPVGLLYDYHGWVWFVGCEFIKDSDKTSSLRKLVDMLNNWISLSEMFVETWNRSIEYIGGSGVALNCSGVGMAANSLIQVVVEWLVWVGKESELGIIWNQTNPKMQFFKSVNVDNAALVNYARKKAEILCRGKWITGAGAHEKRWESYKEHMQFASDFPAGAGDRKELYKSRKSLWNNGVKPSDWLMNHHDTWNHDFKEKDRLFCIDLEKSAEKTIVAEPWYTYIVKWGNVVVTSMDDLSDDSYYYDVYILGGWSLLLDNVTRWYKRVITKEWFIEYKHTDAVTDPNEIINKYKEGIETVLSASGSYRGNNVAVGAFIKWNFVIDWQLKHIWEVEPDFSEVENRISNRYFVYWKLTTKDSVSDLENLFSWRCPNWISSDQLDEKYCPQSASDGSWINPYENAPLVIIDQNYDSPVFN